MAESRHGRYRGKEECIFGDGTEQAGDFCEWNLQMTKKLSASSSSLPEPYDRIDLCRLCMSQGILRAVSFVGTCLKNGR